MRIKVWHSQYTSLPQHSTWEYTWKYIPGPFDVKYSWKENFSKNKFCMNKINRKTLLSGYILGSRFQQKVPSSNVSFVVVGTRHLWCVRLILSCFCLTLKNCQPHFKRTLAHGVWLMLKELKIITFQWHICLHFPIYLQHFQTARHFYSVHILLQLHKSHISF